MRIGKKLIVKNEKTAIVSNIFDKCIKELGYQFLDRVEFHLGKENKVKLEFPDAYIFLNYNNPFIQESDKKAIKIIILKKLIYLVIINKYPNKKIPKFILEIISNRELIRKGYDKDLFYYYYLLLIQYEPHTVNELSTFMKINIPWLSYYGIDNYDSKTLKKLISIFKYRKEFELQTKKVFLTVKKDLLNEKRVDNAIEAYNTIKRQ